MGRSTRKRITPGCRAALRDISKTDAAKDVMKKAVLEIIEESTTITVSSEQIQTLLTNLKAGVSDTLKTISEEDLSQKKSSLRWMDI